MKELLNTGANLPLEYDEETDSLVGQIKGYSVVIKENLQTSSYGCIFWIKPTNNNDGTDIEAYLEDERKNSPELIKNFMVDYPGVAVALNRTGDDFGNVTALKKFLFGFASKLNEKSYVNCCGECGKTENLGIYNAGEGVIEQACTECGADYKLMITCVAPVAEETNEEVNAVAENVQENDELSLLVEIDTNEATDDIEKTEEAAVDIEENTVSEEEMNQLMFTAEEQPMAEEKPVQQESATPDKETQEEFNALLFTGEEEKEPERPKSKLFEEAEREYAEEQARLAAENKDIAENNLNDLLINEDGNIELKEIEQENDDGSSDVTEYSEEEVEGEDFDVEEIESTVNKATVTTGHPMLDAEETPLEADGSVPLINPNSQRDERQVSPVDGPDAVQPLEGNQPVKYEESEESDSFVDTVPAMGVEMPKAQFAENAFIPQKQSEPLPVYSENNEVSTYKVPSEQYNSNIAVMQRIEKHENNVLKGIIGALGIGLIGFAFWLIIGMFVSAISVCGVVVMVGAVFAGYWFGCGKVDKKGVAVCVLISVLLTVTGVFAIDIIGMKTALEETYFTGVSYSQSFEWYTHNLKAPDMMEKYGIDFIITGILMIASDIVAAVYCTKNS